MGGAPYFRVLKIRILLFRVQFSDPVFSENPIWLSRVGKSRRKARQGCGSRCGAVHVSGLVSCYGRFDAAASFGRSAS